MDDKPTSTVSQTNVTSQDPMHDLQAILSGGTVDVVKPEKDENIVINAPKLTNSFLRLLIGKLKGKGKSMEEIIEIILKLDKALEVGELKVEDFEDLNKF